MSELLTAITTGVAAFIATNIDDIIILTLFFAQVNATFRRRHIVVGQYLGFTALLVASLPSFFSGLIVPQSWIRLLGLVPIVIGLSCLLKHEEDSSQVEEQTLQSEHFAINSFLSPQSCSVAAVTVANGSDNIGVYVPLFASSSWQSILVILGVFFLLVGVWCYTAYKLTHQPAIADVLTRYGNTLMPFVLIGLGVFIVWKSVTLTLLCLIASSLLWFMTVGRSRGGEPEVAGRT
jgi:cadmium resistance transport/sequestration family protein